jgi:hypothetical protein
MKGEEGEQYDTNTRITDSNESPRCNRISVNMGGKSEARINIPRNLRVKGNINVSKVTPIRMDYGRGFFPIPGVIDGSESRIVTAKD